MQERTPIRTVFSPIPLNHEVFEFLNSLKKAQDSVQVEARFIFLRLYIYQKKKKACQHWTSEVGKVNITVITLWHIYIYFHVYIFSISICIPFLYSYLCPLFPYLFPFPVFIFTPITLSKCILTSLYIHLYLYLFGVHMQICISVAIREPSLWWDWATRQRSPSQEVRAGARFQVFWFQTLLFVTSPMASLK